MHFNTEHLIDEWKSLQFENIPTWDKMRIDHYWNQVFKIKFNDQIKYPILTEVVKTSLTLIHGSADVERGFSRSSRIMTEDRASMSVRMLNARLTVSDALKQYENKPELVPITKKLLTLANVAYKSYKSYLEQEQRRKEEKTKKEKEAEEIKAANEREILNLSQSKKGIKILTDELKAAKENESVQLKVSDKLLDEANKRLKKALNKEDFHEAKLAQAMIEGVMKSKEECQSKRKMVDSIQKQLEKKKDSVITSFFAKKQRIE